MPYIKVLKDNTVVLGGALIEEYQKSEGWFFYEGEVWEDSQWDDTEKKVIPSKLKLSTIHEILAKYLSKVSLEYKIYDVNVNVNSELLTKKYDEFKLELLSYASYVLNSSPEMGKKEFIERLPRFKGINAADTARYQRNKLLLESDVYLLPDNWAKFDEEKQKEFLAYREKLRDLTLQPKFPREIAWPVKP
jgi:hypothetical protein